MSRREGRGGNWNRSGRRSGGYRRSVVYARAVPPSCAVPDCKAAVTMRVPVQRGMPDAVYLDGKWWVGFCEEHGSSLTNDIERERRGGEASR